MKKRSFTYALSLMTIFCLLISAATAAAPNSEVDQLRLGRITSLTAELSITAGQADCYSAVQLRNSSDSVTLTMKLQRSSNGTSWTTLKTWTATGRGSVELTKNWSVAPGFYYQTVATAEVYTSSGSLAESATFSSPVVKY